MPKRYVSVWFRYLKTDWVTKRSPQYAGKPFLLTASQHGRMIVTEANAAAEAKGIFKGSVLADARAAVPGIEAMDERPDHFPKVLEKIGEWFIRYAPVVSLDEPDGILLDATGCAHLWGGEASYLKDIEQKMKTLGYTVQLAMADSIGAAWGLARYGNSQSVKLNSMEMDAKVALPQSQIGYTVLPSGKEIEALGALPPEALRLDEETVSRLKKLGLTRIKDFIRMPPRVLQRRFGNGFMQRLQQAIGAIHEFREPIVVTEAYAERLPCLEPIAHAAGIEIALQKTLFDLCGRLQREGKGLRNAIFRAYRTDGKCEEMSIEVGRPSCSTEHLFKLFEPKISTMEPAMGIELFVLEAPVVEAHPGLQTPLLKTQGALHHPEVAALWDRLANRLGPQQVQRVLPEARHMPEQALAATNSLDAQTETQWRDTAARPIQLLPKPEPIQVAAPVPDYPPMHFRHRGKLHKVVKADGPERIEQPWWIRDGKQRDYYHVEDEEGRRYWLFRAGHYGKQKTVGWYMHGYCA
jgi:protein ImuB